MDKIKLRNGSEIPVIRVLGGQQHVQNSARDTLVLTFDTGVAKDFDALLTALADTSEITVTQTSTVTETDSKTQEPVERELTQMHLYTDYTIIFKRAIERDLVSPETPSAPAAYKDVYVVGIAQKTYTEKLLETLTGR